MSKRKAQEPMTDAEYAEDGCHCPHCRSSDYVGEEVEINGNTATQAVNCNECGKSWYNIYKLTGWEPVFS